MADRLYLIRKGCLHLFFTTREKHHFPIFSLREILQPHSITYTSIHRAFFSLESIKPTEISAIRRRDFFSLVEQYPLVKQIYEEKLIDRFRVYQQLFLSRIKDTRNSSMKNY